MRLRWRSLTRTRMFSTSRSRTQHCRAESAETRPDPARSQNPVSSTPSSTSEVAPLVSRRRRGGTSGVLTVAETHTPMKPVAGAFIGADGEFYGVGEVRRRRRRYVPLLRSMEFSTAEGFRDRMGGTVPGLLQEPNRHSTVTRCDQIVCPTLRPSLQWLSSPFSTSPLFSSRDPPKVSGNWTEPPRDCRNFLPKKRCSGIRSPSPSIPFHLAQKTKKKAEKGLRGKRVLSI